MSAVAVTMRSQIRFGLVASIVFGLFVVASPPAFGACGPPTPLPVALAQADGVFVGLVESVSDHDRTATMTVLEVWKGRDLPQVVTVSGTGGSGSQASDGVERTYQVGRTYLVVPLNASPPFEDSLCTGTSLYRPTGTVPDEFAGAVGATTVRAAIGPVGTPGDVAPGRGLVLGWVLVGILVLGASAVGVGMRLRPIKGADAPGKERQRRAPRSRWYSLDGAMGRSGVHTMKRLRSHKR